MGTTTDTKSTITLFDRANSQLKKIIIIIIIFTQSPPSAFSPLTNKSLHYVLIKICTSSGDGNSRSPLLVQVFATVVYRLLFIAGKNAQLMVVSVLKNSVL